MKRTLQFLIALAILFGGIRVNAQTYVDTVQLGYNFSDLSSLPVMEWGDAIQGPTDTTFAEFPFTKQFTFTPDPNDETTTDNVIVDVTVKVDGYKVDDNGERYADSIMYIRNFGTGTFGVSPIPYEDNDWVGNGDTRQVNDDEVVDIVFESINNQPPNELYPAVQMKIYGISGWGHQNKGANLYLNGELVAYFDNDYGNNNFWVPLLADLETREPVAIVVEEGDTLSFKKRSDGLTYFRFRGLLAVFEDTDPATGISLSAEGGTAEISEINGSLRILADVSPADASDIRVSWTLENNDINATINPGGLVQAYPRDAGNGTVTVRGTVGSGETEVTSTIEVSISGQYDISVDSIYVTSWNDSITENGGTLRLQAEVYPDEAANKEVVWSVDDAGTGATIDETGLLTASALDSGNGTVIVMATAADGSGVSDTMEVHIVNQETVFVESITITYDGEFAEILENGGSLQLLAEVAPDIASDNTVTWSLENNDIGATIDENGLVTASGKTDGNGVVTAKAAANDGSGVFATVDVIIANQSNVSVPQIELSRALSVYPNPTNGNQDLKIEISDNVAFIKAISIFDITGRKISETHKFSGTTSVAELSLNADKGIYLIKVDTNKGSVIQKVIKK